MEPTSASAPLAVKPPSRGPLDAFFNLLNLATAGWLAVSIGSLLFAIINRYLPLAGGAYGSDRYTIQFNLATIIIVLPVFLVSLIFMHKFYGAGKLNHQSGVHRWLTYLTLFVTAIVIIGSLIALIYNILNGEYAATTILKILTVLLIALAMFGYYLYDLQRKDFLRADLLSKCSLFALIIINLAVMIVGFLQLDTPLVMRERTVDANRSQSLEQLQNGVTTYFYQQGVLPGALGQIPNYGNLVDPETKQSYEYRVLSASNYELCATFSRDSSQDCESGCCAQQTQVVYYSQFGCHPAGRKCWIETVSDTNNQKLNIPVLPVSSQTPAAMPVASPGSDQPVR